VDADSPSEVSRLLVAWRDGDPAALDALMPLVYQELHRIASRVLHGEGAEQTLQATALIHEAYLRLVGSDVRWQGRNHFFAIAARAMRRILVDRARGRGRRKRGGGAHPVTLEDHLAVAGGDPADIQDLDEALERLAVFDERKARAVELHYFGGLSYDEVAEVLEVSPATIHRELRLAKAWLYRELQEAPGGD